MPCILSLNFLLKSDTYISLCLYCYKLFSQAMLAMSQSLKLMMMVVLRLIVSNALIVHRWRAMDHQDPSGEWLQDPSEQQRDVDPRVCEGHHRAGHSTGTSQQ